MTQTLIRGIPCVFTGNPFLQGWEAVTSLTEDGAILVEGDKIKAVAPYSDLRAAYPEAEVAGSPDTLLLPGFVDAHVHYPQTAIIASWGRRLIDWLNTYTFPEEGRFGDAAYARQQADRYLDTALAHGTTTVASYCTIHPESVDAFFDAAAARNMAVVAGKTCMDRNAPEFLRDTAQSAYDDSKTLLERWHATGRARYAITPRFAPTSSEAQLEAMGTLWREHPECLMQTHLSEQVEEIAWVKELYPGSRDYLDVYEKFGLIGPGAVFGHAIHLEDRERAALLEAGAAIIHCPTSNTFIGSGLFDLGGLAQSGQKVGLATDIGGGSSFSMLRTMAAAYEVAQLRGRAVHAAELLWLATAGSAQALGLDDQLGTLVPGMAADIIALDLASTPAIAQRRAEADTVWDAIFPTVMMGDDRAIAQVWVAGRPVGE